jgi:hypothetical protein
MFLHLFTQTLIGASTGCEVQEAGEKALQTAAIIARFFAVREEDLL